MITIENEYIDKLKYSNLTEYFIFKKYKEKLFSLSQIVVTIKQYNRNFILIFIF
ncbi:hypothetical protein RHMOL_Rhmol03G0210300 [Rhododendron molle]|uniref:Uncharacterized protein n=1 Tax=Rhododendron molle TaxID=49168 RepID=A0ACC0PGG4_RHOML|nr:hypothetical protein RHMOL_Rhmol03G0210300 [Rhododendron molle]